MQQAIEGLEQQLSCLAKNVGDLKREAKVILEQRSRRNLDLMSIILKIAMREIHLELDMVNRSYKRVPRNKVRNGGNYVKIDELFHKRRGDVESVSICPKTN
ncbi:hypothetical protein M9H77_11694 [Catharanthus roseus]|uniref:Uncharacterized protein n=1 Tax=Catharanthus roseus TaxID=4058 RepID=A0ACC0BF85_CATRO|nr:hypothetical protein M9H77_11694 [Catharanthus roseus]